MLFVLSQCLSVQNWFLSRDLISIASTKLSVLGVVGLICSVIFHCLERDMPLAFLVYSGHLLQLVFQCTVHLPFPSSLCRFLKHLCELNFDNLSLGILLPAIITLSRSCFFSSHTDNRCKGENSQGKLHVRANRQVTHSRVRVISQAHIDLGMHRHSIVNGCWERINGNRLLLIPPASRRHLNSWTGARVSQSK